MRQGVYIFGNEPLGWYKVGMSQNIEERFRTIQQSVPFPIEEIAVQICRTEYIRGLESFLHATYTAKRIRGEWFSLSQEDISAFPALVSSFSTEDLTPVPKVRPAWNPAARLCPPSPPVRTWRDQVDGEAIL